MTRNPDDAYLMGAVEALLFVSDEPVTAVRLATFLETAPEKMDAILVALAQEYEQSNRGMQLREVAGGWRFYSHPAYHEIIEKYVVSWDTRRYFIFSIYRHDCCPLAVLYDPAVHYDEKSGFNRYVVVVGAITSVQCFWCVLVEAILQ